MVDKDADFRIFRSLYFPNLHPKAEIIIFYCVKLLHKHDKLTQCCRAFTLALARLSCLFQNSSHQADFNRELLGYMEHVNAFPTIQPTVSEHQTGTQTQFTSKQITLPGR